MTTQNQTSTANKISTYLMFIILVVLGLSIVALVSAAYAYVLGSDIAASFLLIIGFFAMGLSAAVLYQSRRRAVAMKIEVSKVMTTIECKKCNYKNIREYQRGDYVFKELDACQKCPDTKQLITAIYKEVKEKEKTFNV
ncbi:hypothetical protein IMZ68_07805 [Candidatus Bathyarchaeota archaeon]|nr:hypothetical protein [Candidatus Bathyarchaeota archaeon]